MKKSSSMIVGKLMFVMHKITKKFVELAEIREKPYFVFDKFLTGFCVKIAIAGKRHYYFQSNLSTLEDFVRFWNPKGYTKNSTHVRL